MRNAYQTPLRPSRARLSRRLLCGALVTMTALCLTLTASAMAWRQPTRDERQAIAQAASRTPHTPADKKVHVSRIHVSTVGPWASAGITIYFGNTPDTAIDILHKVHGKWINVTAGTSGEECVMPSADRLNLGFLGNDCP